MAVISSDFLMTSWCRQNKGDNSLWQNNLITQPTNFSPTRRHGVKPSWSRSGQLDISIRLLTFPSVLADMLHNSAWLCMTLNKCQILQHSNAVNNYKKPHKNSFSVCGMVALNEDWLEICWKFTFHAWHFYHFPNPIPEDYKSSISTMPSFSHLCTCVPAWDQVQIELP